MLLLSSLYSYIFLSDCKIATFYSIYKYLIIGIRNSKMNNQSVFITIEQPKLIRNIRV